MSGCLHWRKDESLTDRQLRLKWWIFCELELECLEDVKAVLNSLLKDVEEKEQEPIYKRMKRQTK